MIQHCHSTDHYIIDNSCPSHLDADVHPKFRPWTRRFGGSCIILDEDFRNATESKAALFSKGIDILDSASGNHRYQGGLLVSVYNSFLDADSKASVQQTNDCRGWMRE